MKSIAYLCLVVGGLLLSGLMARDMYSHFSAVDEGPYNLPTDDLDGDDDLSLAETEGQLTKLKNNTDERLERFLKYGTSTPLNLSATTADPTLTGPAADASDTGLELISDEPAGLEELQPQPVSLEPAPATSEPRPQQTPVDSTMITPGNFKYLGAFRPEMKNENLRNEVDSRFGFGGSEIAFRPDGDPNGANDGFPGSLYLVGHQHQMAVAEISIPKPAILQDKQVGKLPVANIIHGFADITKGIRNRMTNGSSEPFMIGGMEVVGSRLHWSLYKYYNVSVKDSPSHGLTSTNLSSKAVRGVWHIGKSNSGELFHCQKTAGYICQVPQAIADRYLGGRNMLTGRQTSFGLASASHGPSLFAYKIGNENMKSGSDIPAVPLMWYSPDQPVPGHHAADRWSGAEWLTVGKKQTLCVIGRKAMGEEYYGLPRPTDCYPDKGYHGDSYEVQMLFYSPRDLLKGAKMKVPALKPRQRWDSKTPGGGINRFMFQDCGKEIGGMAYDRRNNLIYIAEINGGLAGPDELEPLPVIHVFRLTDGSPVASR